MVAKMIKWLESYESTNDEAIKLVGDPNYAAVAALRQTGGRGRLGRRWHSPSSAGLYISWLAEPQIPQSVGGAIPLLAAVATAKLCEELNIKVILKWPNDVLADGRKLAGILCEARTIGQQWYAVVGIGLNVNVPESGWPAELTAVALDEITDYPLDKKNLAQKLVEHLKDGLDDATNNGIASITDRWLSFGPKLGTRMRRGDQVGRFSGLANDGSLRIETATGIELIHAGDVHMIDEVD